MPKWRDATGREWFAPEDSLAASAANIDAIRVSVERCERTHQGEYKFCENFGCMSMRTLLSDGDQLRADLEAAQADAARMEILRGKEIIKLRAEVDNCQADLESAQDVLRTR